jgi:hypothetical protein
MMQDVHVKLNPDLPLKGTSTRRRHCAIKRDLILRKKVVSATHAAYLYVVQKQGHFGK